MSGQDRLLPIRTAALDAAASWRELVLASRPSTAAAALLPFLVAAIDAARGLTLAAAIGALVVAGPFNLARHGWVTRTGLRPDMVAAALVATVVPGLLVLALAGAGLAALLLLLAVVVASVPVALGRRAVARSSAALERVGLAVAAVLALLVAAAGALTAPGADLGSVPWTAVIALAGWTVGLRSLAAVRREPTARDLPLLGLAGVAVAMLALLQIPGLGGLAACGVALYLLLPAMPAMAAGRGPVAVEAAAHRALADRRGLHLLVGTWLAGLLAIHWGWLRLEPWTVAVVGTALLVGFAIANALAIRLATRRRRVRGPLPDPSLTIVVPAVEDAARLPATLASVRAQTYADTRAVVVVDAAATDGAIAEAAAWLGEDCVMAATPTPVGWDRRTWLRHLGATANTTDLVLFVDPDTILAPVATRILVEQLEATGRDVLSGVPRDVTRSAGERAAAPGRSLRWFGAVPAWWPALTGGRPAWTAMADAGLLLIRREAYVSSGGLAVTPGATDGHALARTAAAAGQHVGQVHAADLAGRRRVRDLEDGVRDWRRGTIPASGAWLTMAVLSILVEVATFLVPFALPAAAAIGDAPSTLVAASAIPGVLVVADRLLLVITQRQPLRSLPWHPVTVLVMVIGQLLAIADHVRGVRPIGDEPVPAGTDVVRSVT